MEEEIIEKKSNKKAWIVLITIAVAMVTVWALVIRPKMKKDTGYQAVFLNTGQVYFGHLTKGSKFSSLTDIYYIQTTEIPHGTSTPTQGQVIIKMGNEIHGPKDSMSINNDGILYTQDLKNDGMVVKAIKDEKAKK